MDFAGRKIERILIRGTNWVGDALMTTPAVEAVREAFPEARIMVLAKPWVAPIYDHPAVDRVLEYDRRNRHRGWAGLFRLASELRREKFDLAVLLQNAVEAALIARLARIPIRIGYNTDGRGLLLNPSVKRNPEDKQIHETEYYLRMLARGGLKVRADGPVSPVFHPSGEAAQKADRHLESLGLKGAFLVGLAPGAAYGPAKQWPAGRFAAAADLVMEKRGGAALVFGSKGESAVAEDVMAHLKGLGHNLAGQTDLAEAAALIARCDLFLSNDSGLMHLAAAVGTPLVAVFGSTNPVTTAPLGRRQRLVRHPVECSPCLKTHCPKDVHECMERVEPEEVAEAGFSLLRE